MISFILGVITGAVLMTVVVAVGRAGSDHEREAYERGYYNGFRLGHSKIARRNLTFNN